MSILIHRVAAPVSFLCIASFFLTTILVEIYGSAEAVATVKSLIVWPGLLILIPAIALTGGSGFWLARSRSGKLLRQKQKRMPFIGANGVLVLIPCAIVLDRWASAGSLDATFYTVQGIELIAGAINLILMGLNMRDGLRMSGRLRSSIPMNQ
ncbi:MAG: hypothetical protein PVG66_15195 [Chromatiales bacterium]|jgi:hypothetical protein